MSSSQAPAIELVNIKAPQPRRGWLHRRYGTEPVTIYNRRGRLVMWIGGRFLPVNGPVVWLVVVICFVAALVGAHS